MFYIYPDNDKSAERSHKPGRRKTRRGNAIAYNLGRHCGTPNNGGF